MEFDELLVTTGVDALVRLVKEKQRAELDEIASILNIAPETIEEWAHVLEEEGILRIEYRLTRVYLVWVKPTEEEVSTQVRSFYEEKKGVETEVEDVKARIARQTEGVEDLRKSFSDFYAKAQPRLEQLEKAVGGLPAGKVVSEDAFAKQQAALTNLSGQLDAVKSGLDELRGELGSAGIGREAAESAEWINKIEAMDAELAAMKSELQGLKSRATQQTPEGVTMPSMSDLKKKFEGLKKDFTALRARNAQIHEDMISLHESSEILKDVAESIMGHEEKVGELHGEMAELSAEVEKLTARAEALSAKVKKDADLVERFEDTVTVAKGILTRFPSEDKVRQELDRLRETEQTLAGKVEALEKLMEVVGGKQVTAKQFTELSKKIDDKVYQMRRDMDSLASSLEDEKATYLTFQKIKERIVPSIEAYQKQLDAMGGSIESIRKDAAAQEAALKESVEKLGTMTAGGDMQGVIKLAQEIQEKRQVLDEIRQSIDDLSALSENLNKRVTLLSREAKLLEIRTGGGAETLTPAEAEAKKNEIRQTLELSQSEEMEFKRKREELKNLISKLWES